MPQSKLCASGEPCQSHKFNNREMLRFSDHETRRAMEKWIKKTEFDPKESQTNKRQKVKEGTLFRNERAEGRNPNNAATNYRGNTFRRWCHLLYKCWSGGQSFSQIPWEASIWPCCDWRVWAGTWGQLLDPFDSRKKSCAGGRSQTTSSYC